MSDIGTLVAELIAAGCAPEVAARAVAEAFVLGASSAEVRVTNRDISVTERDERRREKDRLRQQRHRDNPRIVTDFRDNPRMSQNAPLSLSTINNLSEERERERKKVSRVTSRGHRLPDDWQPSPQDWTRADGLIGSRAATELEKFRDHWKQQPGQRGVKLDWDAAWRNWIRRAADYGGQRNGKAQVQPGGSLIAAIDRRLAELEAEADPALPESSILRLSGGSVC